MISVTVLAKNGASTLKKTLQALESFDEVLLYDTGSTDNTKEIALSFPNVTLKEGPFEGFGPSHNQATALAKHDWILSVDTDEVLTKELQEEIQSLVLKRQTVYSISRNNFLNGKRIRFSGWSPDRIFRLYNRKDTSFTNVQVHERVETKGLTIVPLKHPLLHYSYSSVEDFLKKMQLYTSLFAEEKKGQKKVTRVTAITHGFFAFFKTYFLQLGILDGFEGFFIALYNGNTAFYKYLKLYEKQ
jgi:glycosyltransferase involved in cell wall biosynthesis